MQCGGATPDRQISGRFRASFMDRSCEGLSVHVHNVNKFHLLLSFNRQIACLGRGFELHTK